MTYVLANDFSFFYYMSEIEKSRSTSFIYICCIITFITHRKMKLTVFALLTLYLSTIIADNSPVPETHLPFGHMKRLGDHGEAIQGQITELNYMIGGKDFYTHFIRKRNPVVFRGVTKDWKATKHWKNESYLLENYADVIFDVELKKLYNGDLNPRRTMSFREFLKSYRNESMYLDSPFPQSPLMNDLKLPLMMQCEVLREAFQSMHLLFSNGATSSPLHADGYENFLAMFSGKKVVYVIEPKEGEFLHMDQVKDFPGLSPINPEAVDFLKYPQFIQVPFHEVVLEAGDILYIPQGWYHQVRSYNSPNIAVSMWFLYYKNMMDKDFSYRDQVQQENIFKAIVDESPETIDCLHQNIDLADYHQIRLQGLDSIEKLTKATLNNTLDSFINNTVLYEEVSLDVPTIYVGSDDRYIYAIDLKTGFVKWKVETREDTGSTCAFNSKGDMIYCGADDGYLRAILVKNGIVVWAYKTGGQVVSSPYVDMGGRIFFGSLDQNIYCLHSNGTLKWRKTLQAPIWSSPVEHQIENLIYIACHYDEHSVNNVFALNKDTGKVVWKQFSDAGFMSSPRLSHDAMWIYFLDSSAVLYVYDSLDGSIIYKSKLGVENNVMASPAVSAENNVFVLLRSGLLLAVNTLMKKQMWQLELGESEMGSSSSPLLTADGMLYVGGGNGTVYAIQSSNGRVMWRKNIGSGIFFSCPRLTKDGKLFIGTIDGFLHALDSETGDHIWSTKTDGPLVGTPLVTRGYY